MTAPNLTLQDQVSLIYTSAGSQREVARRLGISHQKVGRILKAGLPDLGGYASVDSKAMRDPALSAIVARGLREHTKIAEAQAKADGIPFNREIPVYMRRMRTSEGTPADRTQAPFLHWVSDRVRAIWMGRMAQTKKFVAAVVGSVVNLEDYLRRQRPRGATYTERERKAEYRKTIKAAIARGQDTSVMYSPKIDMDFRRDVIADNVDRYLARHESAIGPDRPGTVRGSVVLMQLKQGKQIDRAKGKGKRKR